MVPSDNATTERAKLCSQNTEAYRNIFLVFLVLPIMPFRRSKQTSVRVDSLHFCVEPLHFAEIFRSFYTAKERSFIRDNPIMPSIANSCNSSQLNWPSGFFINVIP